MFNVRFLSLSTPPFSSEEEEDDDDDESGEDSAYITSSRDKPSASVHLTPTRRPQRAGHELNSSDSDDSDDSDTQKPQHAFSTHGERTNPIPSSECCENKLSVLLGTLIHIVLMFIFKVKGYYALKLDSERSPIFASSLLLVGVSS